ncbi:hypothetical protein V1505DRAFT_388872 [Lipomyces doorenjongii]
MADMSFARINFELGDIMRQMMAPGVRDSAVYQKFEQNHFQYAAESGNIAFWVAVTFARLVIAKMTLILDLPVLFSSPSEHFSHEMRTKLLVSAIEVAEYNHALNAEQACRKWRWVFQTCTHWHAIVYLMIEISRRPWSPIVERAWVALHSSWLIPTQPPKDLRICVPLRKLMDKARKHRDAELHWLRNDPQAAARLEMEEQKFPLPSSSGPFPGSSVDVFRERWRQLVAIPERPGCGTQTSGSSSAGLADSSMHTTYASQPTAKSISAYSQGDLSSDMTFEPTYLGTRGQQAGQTLESTNVRDPGPAITEQTLESSYNPADWSAGRTMEVGFVPWLWADADPSVDLLSNFDVGSIDVNMDLEGEVNWYNWVESAKGMEQWDAGPGGIGQT